jgi:hypothetical protein
LQRSSLAVRARPNGGHDSSSRGCRRRLGGAEPCFGQLQTAIISCRGRPVDEPTHPSPLRADRGGQARHWTRERQTRQRTPLVAARTDLEPTRPISAGLGSWLCRDCVVSRAIDPAPVVALRIAHSEQPRSGAFCSQLATQERPSPNPQHSPHAALSVEGSWCTETSALLRFETGEATAWKRL